MNWTLQCQIAEELSDLPELYETIDNINVVVNILLSIQYRDILLNSFMVDTLHMKPLPSSKVGAFKQLTKAFLECFIENNDFPFFCRLPNAASCHMYSHYGSCCSMKKQNGFITVKRFESYRKHGWFQTGILICRLL